MRSAPMLAATAVVALTTAVATNMANAGPAQAQDREFDNIRGTRLRQIFDRLDRDRNGYIDLKEVESDRQRTFDEIDRNGDDVIIEGEYMNFQSRFYAKNLTQSQFDRLRRKYDRIDRNHDKRMTLAEYQAVSAALFSNLDANRDGKVPWEEYNRPRNPLDRAKSRWPKW